jgi:hypothetical protein
VRRAAARSQCANNLKQIALGLHNYADAHAPSQSTEPPAQGLPAGTVFNAGLTWEKRLSWFAEVLPYLEQQNLYRRIERKEGWDAPLNASVVHTPFKMFRCPDWGREAEPDPPYLTAYLGVAGLGADAALLPAGDRYAGVFGFDRRTALTAIEDGTSNTLLVLESAQDNGPWAQGGSATVRGLVRGDEPYLGAGRQFGGTHFAENTVFGRGRSLGCNGAMADGSVRFLPESVASPLLEALVTVAGGEEIDSNW